MTLYDGPLASVVGNLTAQLGSAGFSLTAPVFEILDDAHTLSAELARDVAHGLVGKTAIHPCQLRPINAAFQVSAADFEAALRILEPVAAAVFKLNGAMCEPTTHRAWAEKIVARAEVQGIANSRQSYLESEISVMPEPVIYGGQLAIAR